MGAGSETDFPPGLSVKLLASFYVEKNVRWRAAAPLCLGPAPAGATWILQPLSRGRYSVVSELPARGRPLPRRAAERPSLALPPSSTAVNTPAAQSAGICHGAGQSPRGLASRHGRPMASLVRASRTNREATALLSPPFPLPFPQAATDSCQSPAQLSGREPAVAARCTPRAPAPPRPRHASAAGGRAACGLRAATLHGVAAHQPQAAQVARRPRRGEQRAGEGEVCGGIAVRDDVCERGGVRGLFHWLGVGGRGDVCEGRGLAVCSIRAGGGRDDVCEVLG